MADKECVITIKIRGIDFAMSEAACFTYTVKKQTKPIILMQSLSDSIHRDVEDLLIEILRQGGF